MKLLLTVAVMFMDATLLLYRVQFVMSVIALQATYMAPAKYTCPTGWTREYYGYLMSSHYGSDRHRTQFTCIDNIFKPVPGTSANTEGLLFYFVEGRCGSLHKIL